MIEAISAAEANRGFSRLLRGVREGHSYIVTTHGRPIAKIVPVGRDPVAASAQVALFERLQSQPVVDVGPWTRSELYENPE